MQMIAEVNVSESSQYVSELDIIETTRKRNDRLPLPRAAKGKRTWLEAALVNTLNWHNSNIKTKSSRQILEIPYMERSNFCQETITLIVSCFCLVWSEVTFGGGDMTMGRNDRNSFVNYTVNSIFNCQKC